MWLVPIILDSAGLDRYNLLLLFLEYLKHENIVPFAASIELYFF